MHTFVRREVHFRPPVYELPDSLGVAPHGRHVEGAASLDIVSRFQVGISIGEKAQNLQKARAPKKPIPIEHTWARGGGMHPP